MSNSLRLVAAAVALAALGGAPPASATPLSEWLSATVSSSVFVVGVTSMGVQSEFDSIDTLPLLPGQTVTLAGGRNFDERTVDDVLVQGQMDWNITNSLLVDNGTAGFERATLGLGTSISQKWQQLSASGLPLPQSVLTQSARTQVTAQFRLDAVTDARMFGGTGSPQGVYAAELYAELMIWNDVLADWQALDSPVPDLVLGQAFEWEARLGPGLYQWTPNLIVAGVNSNAGNVSSLAFDTSFDLTLELSEVAAPPPPDNGVPEPASWALVAAGLAAWRTGRRRTVTP